MKYSLTSGEQISVYIKKRKRWDGPYQLVKAEGKQATVPIDGREKTFSITLIVPASGRNCQAEMQRLDAAMTNFKMNAPEVMITEIIKSSDTALPQPRRNRSI